MSIPNVPPPRPRTSLGVGIALVAATAYFAREVLIPIALALLLTFLLAPLVRRFERWRAPRVAAVLFTIGLAGLLAGGVGWLVELEIADIATRLPEYKRNVLARIDSMKPTPGGVLAQARAAIVELADGIGGRSGGETPGIDAAASGRHSPAAPDAEAARTSVLLYVRNLLGPAIHPIATAVAVFVLAIFMLLKREDMRNRFFRLLGERELHLTTPALEDAATRVGTYLRMQSIINGATGLVIGVGLYALGVPSAPLWGLLIALFRFVPYVGIWIIGALPVAVAFAQSSTGWFEPLMALGLILTVELIVGNFAEPMLIGAGTGLSPLAVLLAAVIWTWLWGPVGLVLAIPMTVCLAVIGRHVRSLEFLNVLLGDEPVLSPAAHCYQRLLAGDHEEVSRIVAGFSKDRGLIDVYDELILPTLRLAEADRHRHGLDDERAQSMWEMLSEIVEDLGERPPPAPPEDAPPAPTGPPGPRGAVVCVPVRDAADELAARMLEQVLSRAGIEARTLSARMLRVELMTHLAGGPPAAVCLSAVPPGEAVHTRVLCKKLRSRFPNLAVVVGLWQDDPDAAAARARLEPLATDAVVTTLKQALARLDAIVPARAEAAPEPARPDVAARVAR